jgi:hypothetical protein
MNEENLQRPLSLAIPAQTGLRLQDCKRERRRRPEGRAPRMARVNRFEVDNIHTDSGFGLR